MSEKKQNIYYSVSVAGSNDMKHYDNFKTIEEAREAKKNWTKTNKGSCFIQKITVEDVE